MRFSDYPEDFFNSFKHWSKPDEIAYLEIKKAFEKFKKLDERNAGVLTMAWATLRKRK
jgi:hypothetical protein